MLLAGLFLGSQLVSWAHAVLVPHATCAEHGEVIHLADVRPGIHGLAGHASDGKASVVPADRAESGHEHCSWLLAREPRVVDGLGARNSPAAPLARSATRAPRRVPFPERRPRYLLAPKQSPPIPS